MKAVKRACLKRVFFYVRLILTCQKEEAIAINKRQILAVLSIVTLMIVLPAQLGIAQEAGITQHSSTTGGELKRHIDISSPWSGGYLYEDMTVIGSASVTESFTMNNLGPGAESDYWKKAYDDFGIGFDVNPDVFPKAATPASPAPVSGSVSKPASAVAGVSMITDPEEGNIRAGFRWLDLF
jgi:hypothetical protein